MAGEGLPVEVACRVLGVSCAGFYAWRFRPPSPRAVRHAWLTDLIREVHAASYGSYGAKRVHAELVLGRGIRVGHNAVAMLMQRAGIAGRNGARKRRGVPGIATAEDLVDRQFRAQRAERAVADRHHRAPDRRGQGLLRGRARRVQPPRRRLVDQPQPDRRADHATRSGWRSASRSRQPPDGDPYATTARQPGLNRSSQHRFVDLIVNIDRVLPQEFASRVSCGVGC